MQPVVILALAFAAAAAADDQDTASLVKADCASRSACEGCISDGPVMGGPWLCVWSPGQNQCLPYKEMSHDFPANDVIHGSPGYPGGNKCGAPPPDDSVATCEMKMPVPNAKDEFVDCSVPGVKKDCCAFVNCVADEGAPFLIAEDKCKKKFNQEFSPSTCPVLANSLDSAMKMVEYCPKLKEILQKQAFEMCAFQMKMPIGKKTYDIECGIPGVKKECCAFVKCVTEGAPPYPSEQCEEKFGVDKHDCPVLSSVLNDGEKLVEYCPKLKELGEQSNKEENSRLFGQSQSAQVPQRHEYEQHMGLIVGGAGLMAFVVLAAVLRRVTTGSVTGSAREFDAEGLE